MKNNPLPRLDGSPEIRDRMLPHCRLQPGDIWDDPLGKHRVACIDATNAREVHRLAGSVQAKLAIHDPPYNLVAFEVQDVRRYIEWCREWVRITGDVLATDASLYVWLGADQNDGFQ